MGFGQEQRLCLLPAAVQFNAPAKILGSDPVLGNWDPDGFSMGVDLGADGVNPNWCGETFPCTHL